MLGVMVEQAAFVQSRSSDGAPIRLDDFRPSWILRFELPIIAAPMLRLVTRSHRRRRRLSLSTNSIAHYWPASPVRSRWWRYNIIGQDVSLVLRHCPLPADRLARFRLQTSADQHLFAVRHRGRKKMVSPRRRTVGGLARRMRTRAHLKPRVGAGSGEFGSGGLGVGESGAGEIESP